MAYFRCELIVGGHSYEATDDLVNWEDVELAYKRADLDGVVRNFSTKFEFANGAYSLLLGEYRANYLQASAQVVFYTRNNSWLWNELFRCALDFSTFSYTGTTCEINAVDDSLASLIKAKRGTEYEYSVANIREDVPLHYDRMIIKSQVTWIPLKEDDSQDQSIYVYHTRDYQNIPMILLSDAESKDAYAFLEYPTTYREFSQFTADKTVRILVDFDVESTGVSGDGTLIILKETKLDNDAYMKNLGQVGAFNGQGTVHVSWDLTHEFEAGYGLAIGLTVATGNDNTITVRNFKLCALSWDYRGEPVNIDAVKPSTLLNRLLKSMNGGEEGITGEIAEDVDTRLENTLLLAAESVRGLDGAKLRTSYTKFCDWMSAEFGFVPVVDDGAKKVTFVHRDSLFKDTEVKDLGDSCTEFRYTVNEGLIYARVRVGYDKVDYDSVNGRDEFRWTNSYETGVTLTDTSLDLISPYRADAYGIEFLAAKRGEDTTDDGSDNDVFMAGAALDSDGTRYELVRGGDYAVTGVISPGTMFNGMYAQRFMVAANEKYIGVFADGLAFASAEGNGEAAVGGVRTDADLAITGRLFTVGEVEVETGDQSLPSDLGGYFRLEKNGATYKGYLKEVGFGVGKAQAVGYTLIVKEVVD